MNLSTLELRSDGRGKKMGWDNPVCPICEVLPPNAKPLQKQFPHLTMISVHGLKIFACDVCATGFSPDGMLMFFGAKIWVTVAVA